MRQIRDHIVEGDSANHQVTINVMDEPGQGGACHQYKISWLNKAGLTENVLIEFQNGPIKEVGVNGLTGEALLAIQIDRLRSFQAGPFASQFNGAALMECEKSLQHLQRRTKERIARGVEGTHQK